MKYLSIIVIAVLLVACGHEDSPEIKKALQIHEEALKLSEEFEQRINYKIEKTQESLTAALAEGDSLSAVRLNNTLTILTASQVQLEEWTASVVEVPGHHHHEPGEPCDHDHSQDAILEGLPDEEILAMQQELKDRLKALMDKTPIR